jgi:hypothetical protein
MDHPIPSKTKKPFFQYTARVCIPLLAGIVFILMTDPYKLPLVLLLIPFALLAFGLYHSLAIILGKCGLSRQKCRLLAIVITSLILLLALLQSIHQLSIKDFLIASALMLGIIFYLRRMNLYS